jgi:hypothetical protein
MPAFANATKFFNACEGLQGWEGCRQYVAPNARSSAQCEPLAGIDTVQAYAEWMAGLGKAVLPGCRYELHASACDEATHTALFFATFTGRHTGDGGPVTPTGKQTSTHYVYALTLDRDDLVVNMVKIWIAPWALKELGWA